MKYLVICSTNTLENSHKLKEILYKGCRVLKKDETYYLSVILKEQELLNFFNNREALENISLIFEIID